MPKSKNTLVTILVFSVSCMIGMLAIPVHVLAATPNPVPDTGQTQSYTDTFGEDSDYNIKPPSYAKLDAQGNILPDESSSWSMVKDNVTGLIWEVKSSDPNSINYKYDKYSWYDAQDVFIAQLNTSDFGGYSDWRLPTEKELLYIINSGRDFPAININYFPNTISSYYWSSTTRAKYSDYAWSVDFGHGNDNYIPKSYSFACFHRAVRCGSDSN